ncbi:aminotransferase class V-fold PLP-dependent enzyme [Patescibacteria group bacterium]|nr:aminotransferase class V-fold PLP-dependent enzyme [Patescibacteria group bacterium]
MKFCQYTKPISTSLSPNTEKDDIDLALKLIFQPWQWKHYENTSLSVELEEEFKKYLGVKYAFSFNSGRSAFWAILEALKIAKGDEILLQAFTCNAAVNPILERGAEAIFVDIDDTLNLDPNDFRKKITSRSKAVMVQHNFGWPAKIEEISKIAKDYNLFLIEDCAHSLGAKFKGKFCGTFGDATFFSFGRDKIISSIFGGMAVTNNEKLAEKIKGFQEKIDCPSNFWIFQQLLHPILVNYLVIPAYGLGANLGRILLGLSHKLSILSKAVYKEEKRGKIPKYFPKRLPNALSVLALNQFKKLERLNKHRREIANFYRKELKNTGFTLPLDKAEDGRIPTFMRYPILLDFDTNEILKKARRRKIYLDDGWRKSPIVPPDTNLEKMKYKLGSCRRAERVAETILNLPTHINISKKDAQKIVDFLKNYGN